jgi:hypothetical protein
MRRLGQRLDSSCMERIAKAVQSVLLASDLNKGLESAMLSLVPIGERDLPTQQLQKQFREI